MQDEEIKRRLLQKIADGEDSIEVFNALAMWRALPVLERIAKALERMDLSLGPKWATKTLRLPQCIASGLHLRCARHWKQKGASDALRHS
jgi:hypothetical protein